MRRIEPPIIRQVFILLLILLMGSLIFRAMLPYLSGVLGAITLYVLLRNPMATLIKKGWNPRLAVSVLLIISFVCILIPVAGIILLLGNKVSDAVQNSERVINAMENHLENIKGRLGYDLTSKFDTSGISSWLSDSLQNFAGGTFDMLIAIGIMYFMLYYMLVNNRQFNESLYSYIPIRKENLALIGKESRSMVRSNAIGIPLVAVAQGFVALIGFLIFGIKEPFFWSAIVTIGSMVPFIGAFLGILPVFVLTLSSGTPLQAWGILLYGLIVVGTTDNLLRLYVLQKLDDVHPLITLVGVIIGVPIFGFIGLIFGPLLISLFLIILKTYKKEYGGAE
jgi:predicted PurR-regulated permease PerM